MSSTAATIEGMPTPALGLGVYEAALFANEILTVPPAVTGNEANLVIPEDIDRRDFHALVSENLFASHRGMRRVFCNIVDDMLYTTQNPTLRAQRAELDEAGRIVWAGRAAVRSAEKIIEWTSRRNDG